MLTLYFMIGYLFSIYAFWVCLFCNEKTLMKAGITQEQIKKFRENITFMQGLFIFIVNVIIWPIVIFVVFFPISFAAPCIRFWYFISCFMLLIRQEIKKYLKLEYHIRIII